MKYFAWNLTRGVLAVAMVVAIAALATEPAGAWGKKKPQTEVKRAVNRHSYPTMEFTRGILRKDAFGNWTVDGHRLVFVRESHITNQDGSTDGLLLAEGREALVTGQVRYDSIVVFRVRMFDVDESIERGTFNAVTTSNEPEELSDTTPR